jgi:hypothetical protein
MKRQIDLVNRNASKIRVSKNRMHTEGHDKRDELAVSNLKSGQLCVGELDARLQESDT